ncbi:ubiquitinyl hydrolase 1 [Malassezia sp. CBS 17886]|nr:ubiquitinyl hydrolase 1 [Malassezia sp. CBS 17886]
MAEGNAEAAANWLFERMDDASLDAPLGGGGGGDGSGGCAAHVDTSPLEEMGFSRAQAICALRECGGAADAAVGWLFEHPEVAADADEDNAAFASTVAPSAPTDTPGAPSPTTFRLSSMISHRGYVAHVDRTDSRGEPDWVCYKPSVSSMGVVVKAPLKRQGSADTSSVEALSQQAYLYFLRRCDT